MCVSRARGFEHTNTSSSSSESEKGREKIGVRENVQSVLCSRAAAAQEEETSESTKKTLSDIEVVAEAARSSSKIARRSSKWRDIIYISDIK